MHPGERETDRSRDARRDSRSICSASPPDGSASSPCCTRSSSSWRASFRRCCSRRTGPGSWEACCNGVPARLGIAVALVVAAVIRSARRVASHRDEPRPGLRDRQQLRHRRGRVRRSLGPRERTGACWGSPGSPSGSCCSRSWCRPPRAARSWPPWPRSARSPSSSDSCIASGATSFRLDPAQFFFGLVFPYLLSWAWPTWEPGWSTSWAPRSSARGSWGAISLEEKLGEGGMGEVWRARHRLLARPAAIKLIRPSFAGNGRTRGVGGGGPAIRARGAGDRPSPLPPYGGAVRFRHRRRRRLLLRRWSCSTASMPTHCCGGSGPSPPERAIYLLRQVCHSLSEAQSYGLVHRDIKPANIFLCRYGEEYDFVKVLDFGIVGTVRGGDDASRMCTTRENAVHGTPAFMAPEQAMGTGGGRARRHLRDRLRGLLAPDRAVRVHRRDPDGAPPAARPDAAPASIQPEPSGRSPGHSMTWCWPVWPRTPRIGRSPPESCRCGWPRWKVASAWTQERAREWWEAHWLSGGALQVLAPQGGAAR